MIVHGGAWDIPKDLHDDHKKGCLRALGLGQELLESGGNAMDAVEAAVVSMEEDCVFDAGCGSFLNEKGKVEMDAIIMDGRTLAFGAVAAIGNVRHPIKVARSVKERTRHCMLVGEGATGFAKEMGFEMLEDHCLVSERELARWKDIQRIKGFHQRDAFSGKARLPRWGPWVRSRSMMRAISPSLPPRAELPTRCPEGSATALWWGAAHMPTIVQRACPRQVMERL